MPQHPDPTISICRYCNQHFNCVQAFVRHLEIHINQLTDKNTELASSSHLYSQEDDDTENAGNYDEKASNGIKQTDNIIYDAVPLSTVYYRPKVIRHEKRRLVISNGYKLKKPRRAAKAVNGVHQCEICGRTFPTGQALGGHKTYHRPKPAAHPFRGVAKEQLCGKTARMLLPMTGEAHSSSVQYSNQQVIKKMHDFDLNIPYRG